jgi:hypothetical protein
MPNKLVDIWRGYTPGDQRGDDEITAQIAQDYPALLAKYPDAMADYARIQKQISDATQPSALGAAVRGVAREIVPAIATAAGGFGSGVLASETGPGAIPAAILGGTAAGAAARKVQDAIFGAPDPEQEAADQAAHPIASKVGTFLGQAPAMLGAGGLGRKATGLAADAAEGWLERLIGSGAAGAMMSGSSAAQQKVEGKDVSILGEMAKGAVTMGPVAFVPGAKTVLGAIGWKAPTDAAIMGVSNALYDHVVNGKEIDPEELAKNIGTDIPGFALVNGLTAALHFGFAQQADGKITSPVKGALQSVAAGSSLKQGSSPNGEQGQSSELTINPADNYRAKPEDIQWVQDVITREQSGDTSPALLTAKAAINADPDIRALYEMRLAASERIRKSLEGKTLSLDLATPSDRSVTVTIPDALRATAPASDVNPSSGVSTPTNTRESNVADRLAAARRLAASAEGEPEVTGQTNPTPTVAQKAAGNYSKEHLKVHGLDISIENKAGSERSGTDATGKPWSVQMPSDYGYIRETEGKDKDHIDVYVGPNPQGDKVWVVNQVDPKTGKFDEHKTFIGFDNESDVRRTYEAAFSDGSGPQRIGGITSMDMARFKEWLDTGDHKKPIEIPKPIDWQKRQGKPGDVVDRLAFEKAQAVEKEGGLGKKSAAAYTETTDPEVLYKDSTANANDRGQSRKLGAFMAPDGSHVLVGTAYANGGKQYVTGPEGKAVQLSKLAGMGYKLIASLKTTDPTKGYAVNYSAQEWGGIAGELRARANEAKSGGVSAVPDSAASEVIGKAEAQGGSVVKTPNASPYEMRGGRGKVDPEVAGRFVEAIGDPKWENKDQADEQMTDAFSTLPPEDQVKMLDAFSPKDQRSGEVDYVDGFERIKEQVYEHYEADGTKEELAGKISGSDKESRPASAAEVSGAEPESANGGAGISRQTRRRSGEGAKARANGSGAEARLSERDVAGRPAPSSDLKARWDSTLESAAANGIDVRVLQAMPGMREGGIWRPGEAILTVSDALNPSHDNIVLAFHELAGHPVFNRLSPEMKQAMYRAFEKLSAPEGFTPRIAEGANVRNVTAEEVLVERSARNLAAEGFDPALARGVAQRMVRLVKGIYLRSALAIQKGLLGYISPDLAQSYFENRMRSFLAGDRATSFLSWMGGPKLTADQRRETWGTRGAVAGVMDYASGATEYREALPETMAAMRWNSAAARFSPERPAVPKVFRDLWNQLPEGNADGVLPPGSRLRELAARAFASIFGKTITAADGAKVVIENRRWGRNASDFFNHLTRQNILTEVNHTPVFNAEKARWITMIASTLQNAQVRLVDPETGNRLYAVKYIGRVTHFVVVEPNGQMSDYSVSKPTKMVTQFPSDRPMNKRQSGFVVEWERDSAAHQAGGRPSPAGSQALGPTPPGTTDAIGSQPERPIQTGSEGAGPTPSGHTIPNTGPEQSQIRYSERGLANVRTNDPHVISRDLNSAKKVEEDVAAYNALHDIHAAAHQVFEQQNGPGKLSLEQFIAALTNSDTPATEKIKARNEELAANGFSPVDETLRPHDLLNEASTMQATDKGYQYAWSLREFWAGKRKEVEAFLKTADDRFNRNNIRLHDLLKRYTEMDLQFSNARSELKDLHGDFVGDLNAGINSARREGVLSQVLKQMDEGTRPTKAYEKVINRLYSKLTGDNTGKFVDMLQQVAKLNLDWKNIDTRQAVEIIQGIVAPADPELKELEGRGMAALTVAFAKSNAHVMELLNIARSSAIEERAQLNQILKDAVGDSKDAIARAREMARKLPKLAVHADRLLTKLEELKVQNHAHLDEMQRARTFRELHDAALPGLQDSMVQMERTLGARTQTWEANNGAEYFVAPKPGATADEVMANKQVFKLAGTEGNDAVVQHIQQNNAWLESIPEDKRGAVWNTVKEMTAKLEHTVALAGHEFVVKRSAVNTFLGSIVDKLEAFGLPSARSSAMRMRRYLAERHAATADADNLGVKWKAAEGRAMEALGLKSVDSEKFQRMFFQSALSFAEKNPDILASHKDPAAAFNALLPQLRKFLERDPDTRAMLARPGAWASLENYYRSTVPAMEYVNGFRKKLGIKIQEQGPDGLKIEREPIGATFFTSTRRISRDAVRMYHDMREGGWLNRLKADEMADAYTKDPDALRAEMAKRFTPDVWQEFVKPLAEREGRAAFYSLKGTDGITPVALTENARKAFEAAGGDAVAFAENLYHLESSGRHTAESLPEFVGKTLQGFQDFFSSIHDTQKDHDDSVRRGIPTPPRLLQDARISEAWPGQWTDYQTYGRYEMHQMINTLAAQGAFGRNLDGMRQDLQTTVNELSRKVGLFRKISQQVEDASSARGGKLQKLIKAEVEKRGESYTALSQADRNLQSARYEQGQFESLMKLQGGLALELRPFMELVSAMAGLTVQGPGTALMQVADFGQSFLKLGIGPSAFRVLREGVKSFAAESIGTLAQVFHSQIGWRADLNARRVRNGIMDPDAKRHFGEALSGLMNDPTSASNPVTRAVFKAARGAKLLTSSGIGQARGENAYVTLKPQALFSQLVHQMQAGFIDGWTSGFEDIVERAAKYFSDPAHAGDHTDPAFKFGKMTDLGYGRGFLGIGSDERGFKYFTNALERYGLNLEQMGRDLVARRGKDASAPALTDDQFRVLASQVSNEVTLESNPATRASSMFTNPVLRMAAPLVSWSIAKSHDSWEAWRNPNMTQTSQNAFKAFATGMLPYLALVPAGLALAWFRDKYDETVLNKKANRQDPLTSFSGMVDGLAWVGTFGVWGDIGNSLLNRDTQRPFSVDNRVYFVSSLMNAKSALQNWFEQGSADYATVYRPLIGSLGGSGYLQYAQILNNALSLDNSEARVTARINASNYLRTMGRELGMDVRATAGGGEAISTPMRPVIGQMVMAAYANDALGFRQAYQQALAIARDQKEPDPQKYVAQKFGGYNPLKSVFKTEPSTLEVMRIMASLPDDGRMAVGTALRLFNGYAGQIGARADYGREAKVSAGRPSTLDDARRAAVNTGY